MCIWLVIWSGFEQNSIGWGSNRTRIHADTACVVRRHWWLMCMLDTVSEAIGTLRSKTVSAVMGWEIQRQGTLTCWKIYQAILIPRLKANLLCPNYHAIVIPARRRALFAFLCLSRVTLYFPGRKSTAEEYERCEEGFRIELTTRMSNGIRKPRGLLNKRRLC